MGVLCNAALISSSGLPRTSAGTFEHLLDLVSLPVFGRPEGPEGPEGPELGLACLALGARSAATSSRPRRGRAIAFFCRGIARPRRCIIVTSVAGIGKPWRPHFDA